MNRRTAMISILTAMFFFSFFYRTSPAVIAPYLSQEFSLGAERLGFLSSIFFYVFAVAQIPLGPALDSIGPRVVITLLGAVGAMGSLIFACSPSFHYCLLGRGLTGFGMSCMYMGTLFIVARWFPPRSFATLAGLVAAFGNAGALTATLPLALLVGAMGWRNSFLLFAAFNLILASLIWITVRDHPSQPAHDPISKVEKLQALHAFRKVLGHPSFWGIAILNFFTTGSFLSIQGLWGGPFLMDVFRLTPAEAGSVLSLIAGGYILGCPLMGTVSDRWVASRKRLALIVLSLYLLPLLLLGFFLQPDRAYLLFPVYFGIGLLASGGILFLAHLKELFPPKIVGTALTCSNFFAMGGAAVLQYLMGWIIERHCSTGYPYPLAAYREAFLLLLAGMALALLLYSRTRESAPD